MRIWLSPNAALRAQMQNINGFCCIALLWCRNDGFCSCLQTLTSSSSTFYQTLKSDEPQKGSLGVPQRTLMPNRKRMDDPDLRVHSQIRIPFFPFTFASGSAILLTNNTFSHSDPILIKKCCNTILLQKQISKKFWISELEKSKLVTGTRKGGWMGGG